MITKAVLDANVLYSPALRDLLMWLAVGQLYTPRFTDEIHDEWTRNVLLNRPDLTEAQIQRTRRLMNQRDPQALVTGYEFLIPALTLPDPNDRHVLAAAIHARASTIVTFNLRDFPATALAPWGIAAEAPDTFLCSLYDAAPEQTVHWVRVQRAALQNPPRSAQEMVEGFRANQLPRFADRLTLRLADL